MEINLPQVPTMLLWSHTQKMIHSSTELLDQPHSLQLYSYYPEIWINLDVHKHKSRIKIVHLHNKVLLSSLKIENSQINGWIKKKKIIQSEIAKIQKTNMVCFCLHLYISVWFSVNQTTMNRTIKSSYRVRNCGDRWLSSEKWIKIDVYGWIGV